MDDSTSDWDSLPPEENNENHHATRKKEAANEEQIPPFNFKGEAGSFSGMNRLVAAEKIPGHKLPKKVNAYDERNDNNLCASIKPAKSLENSLGTPTSVATIVDKSLNDSKLRPPLLRKPNKEESDSADLATYTNHAFDDDDNSIREKPSHSEQDNDYEDGAYPKSDEKIVLYHFDEPAETFLQINEERHGLRSEAASAFLVEKSDLILSEILGFLRIPFVLAILLCAHIFMFFMRAFFKPVSDYLLKPCLVAFHNWTCVPLCGLSHHVCILSTHAMSPCCRLISVLCCSNRRNSTSGYSKYQQHDASPI